MKNKVIDSSAFSLKAMMFMALPSYFFPAVTAWLSGWVLHKKEIMQASFISIAIPSLIATLVTYGFFWVVKEPFKTQKRIIKVIAMLGLNLLLAGCLMSIFRLYQFKFDIILSTVIGTVITTWKVSTPKKLSYESR